MKILLAEDERRMAQALKELLKQENYEVDHFEDGLSALDAIEGDVYDMIILDVMMPGMNGLKKKKNARAKVTTRWRAWTQALTTISPSPSWQRNSWPGSGRF